MAPPPIRLSQKTKGINGTPPVVARRLNETKSPTPTPVSTNMTMTLAGGG